MSTESTPLQAGRLPVMVVSHERSGTHFTMNALAACFDYVSAPWIDIDWHHFNINYYYAPGLKDIVVKLAGLRIANLIKSHYEFEFFKDAVAASADVLHIVYVYRNPADVMASYWRYLPTWEWVEGPTAKTALDLANAAPMGHLMRYQFRQYPTMLDRWANHVEGWIGAAQRASNIHIVRYEDLAGRYDETIAQLGRRFGVAPSRIAPPARDVNVVQAGPLKFTPDAASDNRGAVTDLALRKFPALMERLGYAPALPASAG